MIERRYSLRGALFGALGRYARSEGRGGEAQSRMIPRWGGDCADIAGIAYNYEGTFLSTTLEEYFSKRPISLFNSPPGRCE